MIWQKGVKPLAALNPTSKWLKTIAALVIAICAVLLIIIGINQLHQDQQEAGTGSKNGESEALELIAENLLTSNGNQSEAIMPYGGTTENDGLEYSKDGSDKDLHYPLFEVEGSAELIYLRTECREFYFGFDDENGGWQADIEVANFSYAGGSIDTILSGVSGSSRTGSIKPIEPLRGFLPVMNYTTGLFSSNRSLLYFEERQTFFSSEYITERYDLDYNYYEIDEQFLENTLWQDEHDYYRYYTLEEPDLTELARTIAGRENGLPGPYSTAMTIAGHLKNNYRLHSNYYLESDSYPNIYDFLFNNKPGSVIDFTTAFLLLSRELGLPARIVFGYRIDPEKDYQVVYRDQLAAFGEIYFEEIGWVTFDSLPGYSFYQPPEKTVTELPDEPIVAIKGESLVLSGIVKDQYGNPLEELVVLFYLLKDLEEEKLSADQSAVAEGQFTASISIDQELPVGPIYAVAKTLESDLYQGSTDYVAIDIHSDTAIKLSLPAQISLGNDLRIEGKLTETPAPTPIPEVNIIYVVSEEGSTDKLFQSKTVTAEDGSFSLNLQADFFEPDHDLFSLRIMESWPLEVRVIYAGSPYYYASHALGKSRVTFFYWQRVLLILSFLAVIVITLALIYVLQKKRVRSHKIEVVETADYTATKEVEQQMVPACEPWGLISFPDIDSDLPLLWSPNEPLKIMVDYSSLLTTMQPQALVSSNIADDTGFRLDCGNGVTINVPKGSFFLNSQIYSIKGSYTLKLFSEFEKRIVDYNTIRILDYREAVIELAETFFAALEMTDPLFCKSLTPRESLLISEAYLKRRSFTNSGDYHEAANLLNSAIYSLKITTRVDYLYFFRFTRPLIVYLEGI
jgi:hypothetical protein